MIVALRSAPAFAFMVAKPFSSPVPRRSQGAQARAGSHFRRIGPQRLEPVVRKRVDDVLLEAPVVPPEQECGELPRKRSLSRRMLSLFVVSESAESQAAGG
jgi:hypothetical protein